MQPTEEMVEIPVEETEQGHKVHLDRWLWAARFFKTRALARKAIENCRILYSGKRVKPNTKVKIGATVSIMQANQMKTVIIKQLSTRRRDTEIYGNFYDECEEPFIENNYDYLQINNNFEQSSYAGKHPYRKLSSSRAVGFDSSGILDGPQQTKKKVRFLRRSSGQVRKNEAPITINPSSS